jgi:hypothetical protein
MKFQQPSPVGVESRAEDAACIANLFVVEADTSFIKE